MRKFFIFFTGYFFALVISSILLFSCKKNNISPDAPEIDKGNSVYAYIKKLGYVDSEIKDLGKEYLVDGDILFAKDSKPDFSIFDGPKTEQYGTGNYVVTFGHPLNPFIAIVVQPDMNPQRNEIIAAVDMWNSIPNTRIKFEAYFTYYPNAEIVLGSVKGNLACGVGSWPMNGKPGKTIQINVNMVAGQSFEQRKINIAHEMGHCIGLRHTNWRSRGESSAVHIPGTITGNDPASIMNGGQCGNLATTFSTNDILAVQSLYPL